MFEFLSYLSKCLSEILCVMSKYKNTNLWPECKIHNNNFPLGWVGLFLGYCILNLYDILEMTAQTFVK